MEKGLEWATGEQALGIKLRSHQQAVPPLSSAGQAGARVRPQRLSPALPSPLCFLHELAQPQSVGLSEMYPACHRHTDLIPGYKCPTST